MTTVDERDLTQQRDRDRRFHLHANTNPTRFAETGPVMVRRAEGVYLETDDGHRVIDGMSGGWCTNVGYGDPRLVAAASEAMQQLSYQLTFGGRTNAWVADLSARMAEVTPEQYDQFFYASTGSDAVESAIKIALYYWHLRGIPTKRAIIGRDLAYHGNTIFATHLVGSPDAGKQYGFPLTDVVSRTASPYWYRFGRDRDPGEFGLDAARALEAEILRLGPDNVAAFIGESIQATLGLIVPPDTYWPEIRRICDRYDVLLIADEVVTGMGKTGRMFGFETYGFEPDLFTLAKGFTSGYFPMSCVAVGAKVGDALRASDQVLAHGFTNCGHPVGAAVALANLDVILGDGLVERAAGPIGARLAERLAELTRHAAVGRVDAVGIIGSVELDLSRIDDSATIADSVAFGAEVGEIAWSLGLHARPIGTTFGMMFPMIITEDQVDAAGEILHAAIERATAEWSARR
jgi:putrescine aminotransferase